jgi:TonB-linked SusC/RagA family outer membrane protein
MQFPLIAGTRYGFSRQTQKLLIMQSLMVFSMFICLQVSAAVGFAQRLTISLDNASMEKVIKIIEKQTSLSFFYDEKDIDAAKPVDIHVKNASLDEVLNAVFAPQQFSWLLVKKNVMIKKVMTNTVDDMLIVEKPPITVRGRVIDENGNPVSGASVYIKDSRRGTSTNNNGEFEIYGVDENAELIISGVNIQTQEIRVNGKSNLDIAVKAQIKEEQEVVVAYGKQKQQAVTGSVTVIKGEQIATLPNRSFDRSLQGLVPGLLVTPGTGQPGGGNSNFVLRGIATNANPEYGSIVRNPLVVVDGVPVTQQPAQLYVGQLTTPINNPLAQLNPSDIESITVLKDAAAIALYGANSSNGVIIVTTKKGKSGKTQFNVRSHVDIAEPTQLPEMLNQQEYLSLLYETYKNAGASWTDSSILVDLKKKFPIRADGSFYPQPDWRAELYNSKAITFSNEISASGGSDKFTFYLNGEYTKQNGIIIATDFNRKSFRTNLEFKPSVWLKFGLNNTISHTEQNYGASVAPINDQLMENVSVFSLSPLNPIYLENGELNLNFSSGYVGGGANALAVAKYNINKNTAFRGLSNLYAEINFLKYFNIKTLVGFDYMQNESKEKADPRLKDLGLIYVTGGLGGRIDEADARQSNLITTNLLRFNRQLSGKHNIGFLLGHEARILNQKVLKIGVSGITSPYYDQITSPGAKVFSFEGNIIKETLLSYFGQGNYNFDDRYFVTASLRRDGSSRFGEDKRFGTYWSAGAGYVLSNESFFRSVDNWISFFKIRGSIGEAGNSGAINRFTPFDRIIPGIYNGITGVYTNNSQIGNSEVKWERTYNWNVGLEIKLLKNRIGFTGDIYKRTTHDLIYSLPVPQNTGFKTILANVGTLRNQGVELTLSAEVVKLTNFKWQLTANWATNANKLIEANNNLVQSQSSFAAFNQIGRSFNSFYLKKWYGVDPANGDPLWIDSTGKPNTNWNAAKEEFVGKSQPDGFGAITNTINYKNIDLTVMIYYQYGYQIYNATNLVNDGGLPYINQTKQSLDHWQKPGDQSSNPKPVLFNTKGGSGYYSTRHLFNGDFFRLQNVSLTYNFQGKLLYKLHLSMLRTYVQGNNLAVWSPGKSFGDPSSTSVYGALLNSYPIQRNWTFGLQAGF